MRKIKPPQNSRGIYHRWRTKSRRAKLLAAAAESSLTFEQPKGVVPTRYSAAIFTPDCIEGELVGGFLASRNSRLFPCLYSRISNAVTAAWNSLLSLPYLLQFVLLHISREAFKCYANPPEWYSLPPTDLACVLHPSLSFFFHNIYRC